MYFVIGFSYSFVFIIIVFNFKVFCLGGGGFCVLGSDYIGFFLRELVLLYNLFFSDKFFNLKRKIYILFIKMCFNFIISMGSRFIFLCSF